MNNNSPLDSVRELLEMIKIIQKALAECNKRLNYNATQIGTCLSLIAEQQKKIELLEKDK